MIRLGSIPRWLFIVLIAMGCSMLLADQPALDPSHAPLTHLLKEHMRDGRVDYPALTQDRRGLDDYLAETAAVSKATFDSWPKPDQLAFLINVYNASTLRLVRDNYPVTSIRKIGGLFTSAWKLDSVQLWGQSFSLDHVEHTLIRKNFPDPRVHFALVCAARGCPPLRPRAYVGATLSADLDEQGRLFMAQSEKNRLDRQDGILWLSPIFDWYSKDFTKDGKLISEAVTPWLPSDDAQFVRSTRPKVRFTEYDWSLNDIPKP